MLLLSNIRQLRPNSRNYVMLTFILSLFSGPCVAQAASVSDLALPSLAVPTTANSVISVQSDEQIAIYSVMGLYQTEKGLDLHNQLWKLTLPLKPDSSGQTPSETNTTKTNSKNDATTEQKKALDILINFEKANNSDADVFSDYLDKNSKSNNTSSSNGVLNEPRWQEMQNVPTSQTQKGRFAATTAAIQNKIYILGGYSTNRVKRPKLTPSLHNISDFYSYDSDNDTYQQLAELPVPVDDAVMFNYFDRYLYVISGWHKDGPVNLVQVFDSYKNQWFQASPLPNSGLFGHAGGLIDNQMLVCDGMAYESQLASNSQLRVQQDCYIGEIDVLDPSKITWIKWVHPSEQGRFRMATWVDKEDGTITFVGGASEYYDLNGLGLNKKAVKPSNEIWTYNLNKRSWSISETVNPVMDIKGMVKIHDTLYTFGGRTSEGLTNKALAH